MEIILGTFPSQILFRITERPKIKTSPSGMDAGAFAGISKILGYFFAKEQFRSNTKFLNKSEVLFWNPTSSHIYLHCPCDYPNHTI